MLKNNYVEEQEKPIVFFDGVCNLCNATVRFILRQDPKKKLMFASLQSASAKKLLKDHDKENMHPDSFLFLEEQKLYDQSTAVLRMMKYLSFPWPMFRIFLIIPLKIRDKLYRFIARRRYKWFGKRESCSVPASDISDRFI